MRPPLPRTARAFSLVEVAIALGITAFAFSALLGMLPVGLGLFQSSRDTAAIGRIVQKVAGDLQQADFDSLGAGQETLYFDEQGNEVGQAGRPVYWAQFLVFSGSALPGGASTQDMARVVIQVAHNPGSIAPVRGSDGSWQEREGLRLSQRALWVARNTPAL